MFVIRAQWIEPVARRSAPGANLKTILKRIFRVRTQNPDSRHPALRKRRAWQWKNALRASHRPPRPKPTDKVVRPWAGPAALAKSDRRAINWPQANAYQYPKDLAGPGKYWLYSRGCTERAIAAKPGATASEPHFAAFSRIRDSTMPESYVPEPGSRPARAHTHRPRPPHSAPPTP